MYTLIEDYDIFEYSYESTPYLIIETTTPTSFQNFSFGLDKIIYCFAFISGSLYRDEINIFSSSEANFQKIEGYAFQGIDKSIIKNITVIPYRVLKAIKKSAEIGETRITSQVFDKIVRNVGKEPALFRCIKLLTEAADLPLELKTSIYSVCLETVRNFIQKKNLNKLSPFKIKADCKKFIKSTKDLLSEFPDRSFNNKDSVIKRLENINQLGNTESFIAIFELLKIDLSPYDIDCLKKRNDFLHGRIPFDNEDELQYVADKLFQLISYLILKYCGYSGIVLNQANLTLLLKKQPLPKEKLLLKNL